MPGFVDAHGHFPGSGRTAVTVDLNRPTIGDTECIPELLDKLRVFGEKRPEGWLIGSNYDDALLAEKPSIAIGCVVLFDQVVTSRSAKP